MTSTTRSRRTLLVGVLIATIVLGAAPSNSATRRINAAGSPGAWRWDPGIRRIHKGDRIVWANDTSASHRVTAYRGSWSKDSAIAPGETTRKRFRKRGLFKFRCTVGEGTAAAHSTLNSDGTCNGMCGRIRVRRR